MGSTCCCCCFYWLAGTGCCSLVTILSVLGMSVILHCFCFTWYGCDAISNSITTVHCIYIQSLALHKPDHTLRRTGIARKIGKTRRNFIRSDLYVFVFRAVSTRLLFFFILLSPSLYLLSLSAVVVTFVICCCCCWLADSSLVIHVDLFIFECTMRAAQIPLIYRLLLLYVLNTDFVFCFRLRLLSFNLISFTVVLPVLSFCLSNSKQSHRMSIARKFN